MSNVIYPKKDPRTGGSKRRKDFHKKIAPWLKKNLKSGHPFDGHKGYISNKSPFKKKPYVCDVCGNNAFKLKGEFYNDKLVNRCDDCIKNGIWEILRGDKNGKKREKKES